MLSQFMFIGTLYETKIQAKTQRSLGRPVPASISARPTTQAFLKLAFELGIAGGPTHGLIDAVTRRTMRDNLKKAILERIPGYAPVFSPRYFHLSGIWNVGRRNEKGAFENSIGRLFVEAEQFHGRTAASQLIHHRCLLSAALLCSRQDVLDVLWPDDNDPALVGDD
jgi:hypothetical protein